MSGSRLSIAIGLCRAPLLLTVAVAACRGAAASGGERKEPAAVVAVPSLDAVPDEERVTGTVTVTATTPATGDGDVRLWRRETLQMSGAASAFVVFGVAGPLEHAFLIAFDDAGAISTVTHKWSNADHSVVVQTSWGAAPPCAQSKVSADPSTRTVTFRGLELAGLDGNTGVVAQSTLTGSIR